MPVSLDYTNMLAPTVAGGVPAEAWAQAPARFRVAHEAVRALRATGSLGFFDLPGDAALLAQSERFAAERKGRYSDVVAVQGKEQARRHPGEALVPVDQRVVTGDRFH